MSCCARKDFFEPVVRIDGDQNSFGLAGLHGIGQTLHCVKAPFVAASPFVFVDISQAFALRIAYPWASWIDTPQLCSCNVATLSYAGQPPVVNSAARAEIDIHRHSVARRSSSDRDQDRIGNGRTMKPLIQSAKYSVTFCTIYGSD